MKPIIVMSIKYKNTTEMIKAAIAIGLKHKGGNGFLCKNCGDKRSTRKFTEGRGTIYGCNKCGARWGSLIKATDIPPTVPEEAPTNNVYSELKVLHSGAGYYIGRVDKFGAPYSRESGYYRAFEAAENQLKNGFVVRDCAENNFAYDSGALPDIRK